MAKHWNITRTRVLEMRTQKPRFFEARARERAKEVEAILHVQDQIEIEEGDKFLIYNFYAQCSRRRAES